MATDPPGLIADFDNGDYFKPSPHDSLFRF
jgi:hypothetical protein